MNLLSFKKGNKQLTIYRDKNKYNKNVSNDSLKSLMAVESFPKGLLILSFEAL